MTLNLPLERLERLQALAQFHLGARSLRPPVLRVDAVAHEQDREPLRRGRSGRRLRRPTPAATPATAAPSPRRRREGTGGGTVHANSVASGLLVMVIVGSLQLASVAAFLQELPAGDDVLDQAAEPVAAGRQLLAHVREERLVRGQQAAAQGIGEQLAAQVVDEFILPACAHERAQPVEPGARRCRRGTSRRVSTGRPARSRSRVSPIGP